MRSEKEQRPDEIVRRFLAFERAALDIKRAQRAVIVTALDRIAEGEPRRKRVTANAVLTELPGHRPGHRNDGAFGRNIMQHHRRAFEHRARSDIDDFAVALAAHDWQHRLDAFERTARIARHHPVPFLRGYFGERL